MPERDRLTVVRVVFEEGEERARALPVRAIPLDRRSAIKSHPPIVRQNGYGLMIAKVSAV